MKRIVHKTAAIVLGLMLGAVAWAGLETVTNISDLNPAWPLGSDLASTSDDHIRNIKTALKNDFPNINGAVTATPAQLNQTTGTWTSAQTYTNGAAAIIINNASAATDAKNTQLNVNSAGQFQVASATDAAPTTQFHNALGFSRTGSAWSTLNFGNATDNPAYAFAGSGTLNIAGAETIGSPTGGAQGAGTLNATGLFINGVATPTTASSPTWTGNHTFSPGSGVAISINSVATQPGININATTNNNPLIGMLINSVSKMQMGVAGATNQGITGAASGDAYVVTAGGSMLVSTNGGTSYGFKVAGTTTTINAPTSTSPVLNFVINNSSKAQLVVDGAGGAVSGSSANDTYVVTTGGAFFASTDGGVNIGFRVLPSNGGVSARGPVGGGLVDLTPDQSTFTGTLTGMTAGTTGTVKWRRIGGIATVWIDADITGTSNTVAMTMTGLPAAITPSATRKVRCAALESGSTLSFGGQAAVDNTGVITFTLDTGAGTVAGTFTNTGGKGVLSGWTITYPL